MRVIFNHEGNGFCIVNIPFKNFYQEYNKWERRILFRYIKPDFDAYFSIRYKTAEQYDKAIEILEAGQRDKLGLIDITIETVQSELNKESK
jgi:hypothetical protein